MSPSARTARSSRCRPCKFCSARVSPSVARARCLRLCRPGRDPVQFLEDRCHARRLRQPDLCQQWLSQRERGFRPRRRSTIRFAGTTCTANVKRTQEITVGFWQNIYKGDVGRFVFGAQYEYVRLTAFAGLATGAGNAQPGPQPQQQHLLHVDPLLSLLATGATSDRGAVGSAGGAFVIRRSASRRA